MANAREYFASGVLRDGRVFVVGGEYSDAFAQDGCNIGEIFDPNTNTWSTLSKPSPQFDFITGDAASCVLPDGRVLFGSLNDTQTAIWDPAASLWLQAGRAFGTLMADSKTSASRNLDAAPDARCSPSTSAIEQHAALRPRTGQVDRRRPDAAEPVVHHQQRQRERDGPALPLNTGVVMAIGGSGHTALLTRRNRRRAPEQRTGSAADSVRSRRRDSSR
jgi:hypothetical protein